VALRHPGRERGRAGLRAATGPSGRLGANHARRGAAHALRPAPLTLSASGTFLQEATKPRLTTEAERKAARKLVVSPDAVLRAAVNRWGHGLADERDRRIGARAETLSPRSLQAVRGRVTRALVSELRPVIKRRRRPNG
jgi:hypothetical protein